MSVDAPIGDFEMVEETASDNSIASNTGEDPQRFLKYFEGPVRELVLETFERMAKESIGFEASFFLVVESALETLQQLVEDSNYDDDVRDSVSQGLIWFEQDELSADDLARWCCESAYRRLYGQTPEEWASGFPWTDQQKEILQDLGYVGDQLNRWEAKVMIEKLATEAEHENSKTRDG